MKITEGRLGGGLLMSQPLRATAGFTGPAAVTVGLPAGVRRPRRP
ncbi:hypothetical protein [Dactylosporangium cerinum]